MPTGGRRNSKARRPLGKVAMLLTDNEIKRRRAPSNLNGKHVERSTEIPLDKVLQRLSTAKILQSWETLGTSASTEELRISLTNE